MISVAKPALIRMLAALAAAGQPLDGLTVHLFVNDVMPGPNTAVGDFVEAAVADFPGYAPIGPVIWGEPFIDTGGVANILAQSVQFNCAGPSSDLVFGYFLTGPGTPASAGPPAVPAGPPRLVFAERFPAPVPVVGDMSSIPLWPRFTFGS